jgi:hypothetical protein
MDFHFEEIDKRATLRPDACTVYYPGVLAFRSTLLEKIFPSPCASLEFLPIHASGEEWTLLNCLKTTSGYDPNDSEVLRGESGEIFLIQKLAVADPSVQECEVFTIADSNRAQLIAVPSFVDRMKKGGIQGLSFREIGQLQ